MIKYLHYTLIKKMNKMYMSAIVFLFLIKGDRFTVLVIV